MMQPGYDPRGMDMCAATRRQRLAGAARLLSRVSTALLLTLAAVTVAPPPAQAQFEISPNDSIGPVPAYAGTGLYGLYNIDPGNPAYSGSTDPIASFTTTNICFPDCLAGSFGDDNGGLAAFTNGNADNITFFDPDAPVPTTWSGSQLSISGYFAVTQTGSYDFAISHDDNMSLSLGSQSIADLGCCGTQDYNVSFSTTGLYAIALTFTEGGGGSYMDLTAIDPSGNCVLGCYDGNNNLQPNGLFYSDGQLEGAPAPITGTGPVSLILGFGAVAAMKLRAARRDREAAVVEIGKRVRPYLFFNCQNEKSMLFKSTSAQGS